MISLDSLLWGAMLLSLYIVLFCIVGTISDVFSENTQDRLQIGVLCAFFMYCFSLALYCAYCFN